MKNKKRLPKKVRITLRVIGISLIMAGLLFIVPRLLKTAQLKKEADHFVDMSTVSTFQDTKTTLIYDDNGEELCAMRNDKDLYYVNYADIPKTLVDSFVVMEDRKFYEHSGIDLRAIARAIVVNQQSSGIAQGASTITQQLARNIFLTQEVTWQRKVEEIFIAVGLERKFSKEQILEFYLNNIYFGNGYYGVEAAAKGYFSKSVSELSIPEQTFIAAIPNNPTRYNPLTKYENTLERQKLILQQLTQNGMMSEVDYLLNKDTEVVLDIHQSDAVNISLVTYARHCATESLMSVSGFTFRNNFSSEDDYNAYETTYDTFYTRCQQKLISGGYTIQTSLDIRLQEQLQKAVDEQLAGNTEKSDDGIYALQGAAVCIDNSTGNVAAIVGSRSQNDITGMVLNRAYQSYRQPGSSIKPLNVYTPYLQLGNNPETKVQDVWKEGGPVNENGVYAGEITLTDAVKMSKNTVAWDIYGKITPKTGTSFLMKMGFHKIWMDRDYTAGALGGFTYGVSVEEMAGGYATIANDGIYRKTTCIRTITDSAGKNVVNETGRGDKVYDVSASRMMTQMLKEVVESGTGRSVKMDNAIIAGKTGTTNGSKDVWFCGYSKYYTTAVWVGYDYPRELYRGNSKVNAIFKQFMSAIHINLPVVDTNAFAETATEAETTQEQETTEETSETESETVQGQSTTAPRDDVPQTLPDSTETIGTQNVTNATTRAPRTTSSQTTSAAPKQTRPMQYGDVEVPVEQYTDAVGTARGEW